MTAAWRGAGRVRWMLPAAAFLGVSAVIAAILLLLFTDAHWSKTRALCDRAVEDLLHSSEPLEVERAGFIVQRLECSIGRRL
jgi:hypothetical protein